VRSRPETRTRRRALPGILLTAALTGFAVVALTVAPAITPAILPAVLPASVLHAAGTPPTAIEISKAVDEVKKDPNISGEMTIKTLRWIGKSKPRTKSPEWPLFAWLRELVRWFERSARLLMWALVAILAAWLATFIFRMVRGLAPRQSAADTFVAPTHVRDLDIRPEALPPNIGAAARALWDRGEHRAALALLYRGLLSRLVHAHRGPIRDSSTEGDCLELAADHLAEASRRDYASRLIRVWQRAVYGSQDPTSTAVYDLCDEFAAALDLAARGATASSRGGPGSGDLGGGARRGGAA
jgi:hypothetical protein